MLQCIIIVLSHVCHDIFPGEARLWQCVHAMPGVGGEGSLALYTVFLTLLALPMHWPDNCSLTTYHVHDIRPWPDQTDRFHRPCCMELYHTNYWVVRTYVYGQREALVCCTWTHIHTKTQVINTCAINISPIPLTGVLVDIRGAEELVGWRTFGGWEDAVAPIVTSEGVPADKKTILKYKMEGACWALWFNTWASFNTYMYMYIVLKSVKYRGVTLTSHHYWIHHTLLSAGLGCWSCHSLPACDKMLKAHKCNIGAILLPWLRYFSHLKLQMHNSLLHIYKYKALLRTTHGILSPHLPKM